MSDSIVKRTLEPRPRFIAPKNFGAKTLSLNLAIKFLSSKVSVQIAEKLTKSFKSEIDFYNESRKWFKVENTKLGRFCRLG